MKNSFLLPARISSFYFFSGCGDIEDIETQMTVPTMQINNLSEDTELNS